MDTSEGLELGFQVFAVIFHRNMNRPLAPVSAFALSRLQDSVCNVLVNSAAAESGPTGNLGRPNEITLKGGGGHFLKLSVVRF